MYLDSRTHIVIHHFQTCTVVLQGAEQPQMNEPILFSSQFRCIMSFLSKVMQAFLNVSNVCWIVTLLYNLSEHPRSYFDSNDGNLAGLHFYYCILSCWVDWLFNTFSSFHRLVATTCKSMYSLVSAQSVNSDSAWVLTLTAKALSGQILWQLIWYCLQHPSIRTIYVKMSWLSSRTFMRKIKGHRKINSKKRKVTDYAFS